MYITFLPSYLLLQGPRQKIVFFVCYNLYMVQEKRSIAIFYRCIHTKCKLNSLILLYDAGVCVLFKLD
jgi:hypothetical protein